MLEILGEAMLCEDGLRGVGGVCGALNISEGSIGAFTLTGLVGPDVDAWKRLAAGLLDPLEVATVQFVVDA